MPHGQTCSRRSCCSAFSSNRLASWKTASRSVVADLTGDDLILSQITSQSRRDGYSVALASEDFERGHLNVDSFIRPNRLFTVEQSVIVYSAAKVKSSKLKEVRAKIRELFT